MLRPALLVAAAALALLGLWTSGALAALGWWAVAQQRDLQAALAGAITALRDGEPAALWTLLGACAAYGFLHAVGPGHGKALVAGAALGGRATARRMAAIALAGSLGQAAVAIALVSGAFLLLGATARTVSERAESWAAPFGALAIALVGAWILATGLRGLGPAAPLDHHHAHDCGCGHAHGPDPEAAARATSPGAVLALVAAIAARPCSGAVLVLVVAWSLGLPAAGVAAVVAMGLGAAAFTALVAWLAVSGRDAALQGAGRGGAARLLAPGLRIAAGLVMLALGGLGLLGALAA